METGELLGKPDEMLGRRGGGGGGGGGGRGGGLASYPGEVATLLVASCYGIREKLQQYGPV